jgi:hypothetical protein
MAAVLVLGFMRQISEKLFEARLRAGLIPRLPKCTPIHTGGAARHAL